MYPEPLTVSQLNRQIRNYLESEIGEVAVTGELSNVKYHSSGHIYCSLKDSSAQVRCAFFRNYQAPGMPMLKDGDEVTITGLLTLYEGRGDYQIIVYSMHTKGLGDLFKQFEMLKQKFEKAGFFDNAHKKPIPKFPKKIGINTSSTGAALHDCLATLKRRYPVSNIIVYPVEVQGKNAPPQIVQALKLANSDMKCDVILLVRGGGSIEDLFMFNDEALVKAVFDSTIPIISGVGHETDFTLVDFVADCRAATPTAAAEAATPDLQQLNIYINNLNNRLLSAIKKLTLHARLNINQAQYVLEQTINANLNIEKTNFVELISKLYTLSPLATLKRGYAVVSQKDTVIVEATQLDTNNPIDVILNNATLHCKVISVSAPATTLR